MTTEAGTGARAGKRRGLASRMFLTIRGRSSFKYLTMEKLLEPEATSEATTGTTAGVEVRFAARAKMQQLLPSIRVPPASSSLPSKGGFKRGLRQAED